jgi:hypothetical protein
MNLILYTEEIKPKAHTDGGPFAGLFVTMALNGPMGAYQVFIIR